MLAAVTLLASCTSAPSDEARVRSTFSAYRAALLAADGAAAWREVDKRTSEYYSKAIVDALSLGEADLRRADFIYKLMVLRLRLEFRKPVLEKLSAEQLFVKSVSLGWISRASVEKLESLEKVEVAGNNAKAFVAAAPGIPMFHFSKEGGAWKIALVQSLELANSSFEEIRKQKDMTSDEFVIALLRAVSTFEPDESIFHGPLE
jgi:hypothetical protein